MSSVNFSARILAVVLSLGPIGVRGATGFVTVRAEKFTEDIRAYAQVTPIA